MKRIILADDSCTARMFIRQCLEIAGFTGAEFVEVADGKAALEAIRSGGADLVVTDLTMPVMDGTEFMKRKAASPRLTDTPVVVITSANNPAKEKELMELGALAVLKKPVTPAILAEVLGPVFTEEGQ